MSSDIPSTMNGRIVGWTRFMFLFKQGMVGVYQPIEPKPMTEDDWTYAFNTNIYRDEEIKAMLYSKRVRNSPNPFVPQSANWYRFKQGLKEIEEIANERCNDQIKEM